MAGPQQHPRAPRLGDLVLSPPPAISLPQPPPRAAGTRVLQPEGCRLSPRWPPGTGGSAGSSAPVPRPRPRGGQRCDVSLGHTNVPLSPGAVGHPWCGVAPFRGVGWLLLEVWGHPATMCARGRDALGGGGGDGHLCLAGAGCGGQGSDAGAASGLSPSRWSQAWTPLGNVASGGESPGCARGWQQGWVIPVPPQQ